MSQQEPVTLVSPRGGEVTVTNPVAVNNLVFGQGYRRKDEETVPEIEPTQAEPDADMETAAGGKPEPKQQPSDKK
jgi:hypothetical protein